MCGSATLATLVSSTSRKVASITVKAISQGLISPCFRVPLKMRSIKIVEPLKRASDPSPPVLGAPHMR